MWDMKELSEVWHGHQTFFAWGKVAQAEISIRILNHRLKLKDFLSLTSFSSVRERTGVSTGLVGCIRMLDVNNRMLNLQESGGDSLYGSGVGECGNNPCQPNPCKNGAACQVKEAEMFHCKCSKGFWGKMLQWCSSAVCLIVIFGFLHREVYSTQKEIFKFEFCWLFKQPAIKIKFISLLWLLFGDSLRSWLSHKS